MKQKRLFLAILWGLLCLLSCQDHENVKNKVKNKKLPCKERIKKSLKEYQKSKLEKNDTLQIKHLKTISYCYSELKKQKPDSVIFYAKKVLLLAIKRDDLKSKAFAYSHLGLGFKKLNQIDSAYLNYNKSKEIYLELDDSLKVAKKTLNLAKIESENELYYESDSTALEALKYIRDKKKNNKLVTSIYNCLGINSRSQNLFDAAEEWYDKAIANTSDSIRKLRYINNKAVSFKYAKNYDKAIKLYEYIINNKFFEKVPLKLKAKFKDNYAYVRFLGKKKVSERDFLLAQNLKNKIKDDKALITNYLFLSSFLEEKDYQKSLVYAHKAYDLSVKINVPNDRIEALDKLIRLENETKIRKLAIERKELSDSISIARKLTRKKLSKVIYNFKEEKTQKEKAQLARKQENTEKWIILLVGVLIMIILLSYIYDRKQKAKKAKLIEVYNTETRLAKRIHDELANDVYRTMHQVQQGATSNPAILENLEKIYLQTRDISHENSPIITGKDYGNSLKQLFADFTTSTCKIMSNGLEDIAIHTLKREQQIVLYRVLQELLVNMKKHSEASMVVITFKVDGGHIYVKYKDNGVGADTLSLKNGLQNMETRIKSIKGTITFETEAEKGFLAKFHFKK